MDSLAGSNFKNGANFAIIGSSTLPKYVPFSLNIQVMQFLHFKTRTLQLLNANPPGIFMKYVVVVTFNFHKQKANSNEISCLTLGHGNLIDDNGFRNALYMIDIGQNDIADSFSKNLSYSQVVKQIPSIISEIKTAMEVRVISYCDIPLWVILSSNATNVFFRHCMIKVEGSFGYTTQGHWVVCLRNFHRFTQKISTDMDAFQASTLQQHCSTQH